MVYLQLLVIYSKRWKAIIKHKWSKLTSPFLCDDGSVRELGPNRKDNLGTKVSSPTY